ncbi:inner membrane protein [Desulfofundulus luciae]|uniref:Inner membrane protein n=1 Tax=Desulfofundulus luciae TaxID=74702 RepID=A0ABU0B8J1_9FIRM|nr:metal-dependent hydrolase [Desulfofundulus luciae]MDQ0287753.1 inner membrane protein [Desulfofundulus luciae]
MLWRTHFLGGAAAGLLLAGHTDLKTMAVSAGIAGVVALLPDLDDPHSKLGRLVAPASWAVKVTVGHRGPLHSFLGAGVMTLLAAFVLRFWYAHAYVYSHLVPLIMIGYLSHLVMDSLNPQGVPWLWPVKTHLRVPLVQTGGILERVVVMPIMLVLCGLLFW